MTKFTYILAISVLAVTLTACSLTSSSDNIDRNNADDDAVANDIDDIADEIIDVDTDIDGHDDDLIVCGDNSCDQDDTTNADDTSGTVDVSEWNSFTHRAYGYTVSFPKFWHWNGATVQTLVVSSEIIGSNSEALSKNNLRIIDESVSVDDDQVEIIELNKKFRLVHQPNHNHQDIINKIVESFTI